MRKKLNTDQVRILSALAWAMLLGVICYFVFISNFLLDGHFPRMPFLPEGPSSRGNFLVPYWNNLFFGANLPVLAPLFAIGCLALSGFLVARTVLPSTPPITIFLAAAFVIAFPFQITVFYYSFATHSFAVSQLLAVSSVALAYSENKYRDVPAGLAVFSAMSTYQPAVSIVFTFWAIMFAIVFLRSESFCPALAKSARAAAALALGALAYFIVVKLYVEHNVVSSRGMSEVLTHIPVVVKHAFLQLWLTQPELLRPVKVMLLIPLVVAVPGILAMRRVPVSHRAVALSAFMLAIILTKTLYFVSTNENFYIYRYNYALTYLYLGAFLLCHEALQIDKRLSGKILFVGLIGVLLWTFVSASLLRQHIQLRAQTMDLALYNRIIARIENLENLDLDTRYTLIIHGGLPNFRRDLFTQRGRKYDVQGAQHIEESTPATWNPETAFRYLGSNVRTRPLLSDMGNQRRRAAELVAERDVQAWPHPSSVFIHEDLIVVAMRSP